MKRYISLFLILTLTVALMAVPASAAENNFGYLDLMQYGGIYYNDVLYPGFLFTPTGDGRGYIDFPVVLPFKPGEIELLIFTGADVTFYTDASFTDKLTQYDTYLDDQFDRYKVVSGSMLGRNQPEDSFRLYFEYAKGTRTPDIAILSAKILPYGYDGVAVPFMYQAYETWAGSTLVDKDLGVYMAQFYYSNSSDGTTPVIGEITINPDYAYWRGLDYIDIDLFIQELEVTSISASIEGQSLPIHYTETFIGDGVIGSLTSSGIAEDVTSGIYKCVIRVDISGASLASVQDIEIFIGVTGALVHEGVVAIDGITGGKYWLEPNPQVTWIQRFMSSVGDWISEQTDAIVSAITGDPVDGAELDAESEQIKDDVASIGQFEADQQAVLDNNFSTIQNTVSVTGFASALAFVQNYTNLIFAGMGDYFIVFSMPLFLGLFFYICSRIPGVTRWKSQPPKDGDKT